MGNGYYFNPVGMSNFDYQCLYNAMKSPNALDPSFRGGSSQSTQTNTQTTTTATQQPPQVQYVQEEKKSHTGAWIAGIGAAALIVAGVYGHKHGTSDKFFKRIFEGLGLDKLGKATTEKAAETAKEAVTKGKYTIAEINGKKVVTLPGNKNVISTLGKDSEKHTRNIYKANNELKAIGEQEFISNTTNRFTKSKSGIWKLNEGNEMTGFRFNYDVTSGKNKGKYTIIGATNTKDGNRITILKNGKVLSCGDGISAKDYETLENMGKDVFAGKRDFSKLDRVTVKHTNKDTGLVSTIKIEKGKEKLLNAVTDKYALDSQKVKALRSDNSTINEALEKYTKEKGKGLTVLRADVTPTGCSATFTIDTDGKVIAIKHKGVTYDAIINKEAFDAKRFDFKKDIETIKNIKPEKWTNVVYELPS